MVISHIDVSSLMYEHLYHSVLASGDSDLKDSTKLSIVDVSLSMKQLCHGFLDGLNMRPREEEQHAAQPVYPHVQDCHYSFAIGQETGPSPLRPFHDFPLLPQPPPQ